MTTVQESPEKVRTRLIQSLRSQGGEIPLVWEIAFAILKLQPDKPDSTLPTLSLPVRIDFIGGWSDQTLWPDEAAVVNAAIGWDDAYPLVLDGEENSHSLINGIGTGLGISSILEAGRYLQTCSGPRGGYVEHVLEWERQNGTCGGWQDQIGGIEPGLKLIQKQGDVFKTTQLDTEIMDWIVLFDTGIRRASKFIGDKVRSIMRTSPFVFGMKEIISLAKLWEEYPPTMQINMCLHAWKYLVGYIPEMHVEVPYCDAMIGHKLVGAGGGGYGIAFCKPDNRQEVLAMFEKYDCWARIPQLLGGVKYET